MSRSLFDRRWRALLIGCAAVVAGCAEVPVTPTSLTATESARTFILQSDVTARSAAGQARTLTAGSHWNAEGTVAEGSVLKPVGTILTVKGVHVHEAYLVVRDDRWVGFWLPNEEAFSPVETSVPIDLSPTGG